MRYFCQLICTLIAIVSPISASSEEAPPVSVCDIQANEDAFIGRQLVAEGRLIRTAHGLYSDMPECPDIYLMVILAAGSEPETMSGLLEHASYVGLPEDMRAPPVIFHARVELNDHTLQGTTHVSKRLMLAVLEVKAAASSR